ncbi:hypothetical protein NPD7_1712 [Clostridium sporogenes]|uniref:hypothetical protein n=1 Tax=Clostridium TaxID=1485 RepID=UPI0005F8BBC2|nr:MULTISPECIES: hypothetical protein [Clostridium]APF26554.1 hypothetical protein NPD7_1712 [Clostridium sporogenes]MDI6921554.1 hypothetical protein [Clostridium botulinum]WMU99044.1 hypothetical protein QA656_07130 [Clostridium botulinum]
MRDCSMSKMPAKMKEKPMDKKPMYDDMEMHHMQPMCHPMHPMHQMCHPMPTPYMSSMMGMDGMMGMSSMMGMDGMMGMSSMMGMDGMMGMSSMMGMYPMMGMMNPMQGICFMMIPCHMMPMHMHHMKDMKDMKHMKDMDEDYMDIE